MASWLLAIAGIVVIGVLVELLLTDSPLHKFVRSIYAFFILLVIVAPLPGLFNRDVPVGGGIDFDWELVASINAQSTVAAQNLATRALDQNNFENVIITVIAEQGTPTFRIERVYINAWHHRDNINARAEIIRIVRAVLNIDEGRIIYHA